MDTTDAGDLDPRIQVELESLNTATDEINKLEIELEEANCTFRILLNESTRRLKLLSKKLGGCIEKSRGYHDARDTLRGAQLECQTATLQFRRANEIYVAAKETVALAEQQFMTNSHEWQFDNAWQEMLNHATIKVVTAEQQKTECHAEHYRLAEIYSAAEQKVSHLEDRFRRNIRKSQPYFDAKQICQDQLHAQKQRIQELQQLTKLAKARYSGALKNLEHISEDIHRQRLAPGIAATTTGEVSPTEELPTTPTTPPPPCGPREPGVGADEQPATCSVVAAANNPPTFAYNKFSISTLDVNAELDRCCSDAGDANNGLLSRAASLMNVSLARSNSSCSTASLVSTPTATAIALRGVVASSTAVTAATSELDLERLRHRVKELAVRPVEGGDGRPTHDAVWETELNDTVNQLDRLMMMRENGLRYIRQKSQTCLAAVSSSNSPMAKRPAEAAGASGISCATPSSPTAPDVPLLQRWSNEIAERTKRFQLARRSSLE